MNFNIADLIQGPIGNQLISGLSKQIGVEDSKVSSAVSMAVPMLLTQLNKNASDPSEAEKLKNALAKHENSDIQNVSSLLDKDNSNEGLGILGHIFGDKQNQITQTISKSSGLSTDNVMQILSKLAPIVMGFISNEKAKSGSNDISGILGNLMGNMKQNGGSNMGMIEKLLDQDGDGSVMDDVMDMGSKLLGGFFKK